MIQNEHLHLASISFGHAKINTFSFLFFSVNGRSPESCCSAFLAARSNNVSQLSQNLSAVSFGVSIALLATVEVAQRDERLAKRIRKKCCALVLLGRCRVLVHANERLRFLRFIFSTIQKFSEVVLNEANYFS